VKQAERAITAQEGKLPIDSFGLGAFATSVTTQKETFGVPNIITIEKK